MQKSIGPVEMVEIDPRVAEMQARAHAAMSGDLSDGWFNATLSRSKPNRAALSQEMKQWMNPQQGNPQQQQRPVSRPGTPIDASLDDRELLARTLAAEAGGEGYDGILAAGAVIRNRVGRYGDNLREVIMKPGHFSAWNSVTGYAGGEGGLNMDKINPSADVYRAADTLISGNYEDPTGGRTHYHTPAVNPDWGYGSNPNYNGKRIGNHIFGWGDK